jgi:hypothetical protein
VTIDVRWYDRDKLSVIWVFPRTFTLDEFYQASEKSYALAEAIEHRHCVIFDMTGNHHLPQGALGHLRSAQKKAIESPKYLFTVTIGGPPLAKALVSTLSALGLSGLFSQYNTFVSTRSEAHEVIRKKMHLDQFVPVDRVDEAAR